ncbi:GyrI-like domain-containing protein [Anaerocolumna sp.]|uniref:GyrI-like domain-containing protein n=1 Tax=Anaerocolumna sp. TaxID=2041569 RepID=UPI0028A8A2B4|nr:GyrI-like domain-containing protein [Anaerocolumna sp.]
MSNFKIEEKEAFRLLGFKTKLEGSEKIHSEIFSKQKTEFFMGIIQSGKMALLKPISECNYGYGAVTTDGRNTFYYAGVKTTQPLINGTEDVSFPEGKYLVLAGKGGLSRLAFDKLEDQAFKEILTVEYGYEYNGNPIAEILLNGNPTDSEVEVWIPVNPK